MKNLLHPQILKKLYQNKDVFTFDDFKLYFRTSRDGTLELIKHYIEKNVIEKIPETRYPIKYQFTTKYILFMISNGMKTCPECGKETNHLYKSKEGIYVCINCASSKVSLKQLDEQIQKLDSEHCKALEKENVACNKEVKK